MVVVRVARAPFISSEWLYGPRASSILIASPFRHPGGADAASSALVCKHPLEMCEDQAQGFIIIGRVNVTQIRDFLRRPVSSKSKEQRRPGDETEQGTLCAAVSGQGRPRAVICHSD